MRLASIAKILACKNRHWRKCSLSLEDTGFVQFLLHKSKLKFMLERKGLNGRLGKNPNSRGSLDRLSSKLSARFWKLSASTYPPARRAGSPWGPRQEFFWFLNLSRCIYRPLFNDFFILFLFYSIFIFILAAILFKIYTTPWTGGMGIIHAESKLGDGSPKYLKRCQACGRRQACKRRQNRGQRQSCRRQLPPPLLKNTRGYDQFRSVICYFLCLPYCRQCTTLIYSWLANMQSNNWSYEHSVFFFYSTTICWRCVCQCMCTFSLWNHDMIKKKCSFIKSWHDKFGSFNFKHP